METAQLKTKNKSQKNKTLPSSQPDSQQVKKQPEKTQNQPSDKQEQLPNELNDQNKSMTKEQINDLKNQQKENLCKVQIKKEISIGFLCRIPDPVLIFNNNVFSDEEIKAEKKINIIFSSKEKYDIILENRRILTIREINGVEINTTIIEIKPNDFKLSLEGFLEFDENFLKNNIIDFGKKNIYLIDYKSKKSVVSGEIKKIIENSNEIEHNAKVDSYSVGCPILLNHKVIAIQEKMNYSNENNKGFLLNFLINEYNKKFKNIYTINCNEEIVIKNKSKKKIENNNQKYIKQKLPSGQSKPIDLQITKEIIKKCKTCLCKIEIPGGGIGSGFFCKIPFPDTFRRLPVLFTNNHVLNADAIKDGKTINFTINNAKRRKQIDINSERKTFTNIDLDTTIIEIKTKDKININAFLDIDDDLFYSSKECVNKEIYVIQYPLGGKCSFSTGIVHSIVDEDIQHTCSTEKGSSGSPIIDLYKSRVIGIHKGYKNNNNNNLGTLIKFPIKEFITKFINNNITVTKININDEEDENKIEEIDDKIEEGNDIMVEDGKSEIVIKMEIRSGEINNRINIFGFKEAIKFFTDSKNRCDSKDEKAKYNQIMKDIRKQLPKINSKNIILKIGDNEKSFKQYLIPKKKGTYNLKLIFKIKLTCCAGMFFNCENLTEIDLSNFNAENVTNMCGMFLGSINITNINFSNFNTQNVTNMSYMFGGLCDLEMSETSFKTLDLSSFNTEKVTDMSHMFGGEDEVCGCQFLKTLDVSSFNTKNVTNMESMFSFCSGLESLNLESFNTEKVISMESMFYFCESLTSLDLTKFNTEKVINMKVMFAGCDSLTSLDLKSFKTNNKTQTQYMFDECGNLKSICCNDKKIIDTFNEDMELNES